MDGRILCMMLGLATSVAALSQHLSGYELEREMPVFLDQLKAELTYPMAWGNSPVKNFKKWRKQASLFPVRNRINAEKGRLPK